jgi:hypothetical protein
LNKILNRNSKTIRETKKTTQFEPCSTSETAGHAHMIEIRLRLLSATMELRYKLNNPMTAAKIPKDIQDIIFDPYDNIWISLLSILSAVWCVQIQWMIGKINNEKNKHRPNKFWAILCLFALPNWLARASDTDWAGWNWATSPHTSSISSNSRSSNGIFLSIAILCNTQQATEVLQWYFHVQPVLCDLITFPIILLCMPGDF